MRNLMRKLIGRSLGNAGPASRPHPAQTRSAIPLHRDPWCGTHVSPEVSIPLEQAGQMLHFCSAECRARYQRALRSARQAAVVAILKETNVRHGHGKKNGPSTKPILPRMAPREDLNPFRIAQMQFDMAAEFLKLDPGLRQILRTPKRVMEVSVPVKMGQRANESFHRIPRAAQRNREGAGQGRAALSPC